jgi:CubicO group peptidase (beta-lactamase class C family)
MTKQTSSIIYQVTLLLLLLVSVQTQAAELTPPRSLTELKLAVEQIRVETGAPAFGITLVENNHVVWVDGLGMANIENKQAATADTMFRIGSVSKVFSSIAVMQLIEQGRLSLQDQLTDVAPEIFHENKWKSTHPVRIVHLLEHTTGWDVHPAEGLYDAPDSITLQQGLANHPDARISRWPPGTRHAYSNTGPVVAAFVVEKITGMTFENYVQNHIFNPLKMATTTYFNTDTYQQHAATLYGKNGVEDYTHVYSRPSSSINASTNDMAKFLQLFTGRGTINEQKVLQPSSITRMEKATTTLGSAKGIDAGYGLTMVLSGHDNWATSFYGHSGYQPGSITNFVYLPETKSGFIYMINQVNGQAFGQLENLLKAYLLRDSAKKSLEKSELPLKYKTLAGYYTLINPELDLLRFFSDITTAIKITVSEDALQKSPFLLGWPGSYYANSDGELISGWHGLAAVAIVNDKIVGETLQIGTQLYKKTSVLSLYGRLSLLIISLVLIASNILFALIWLPRLVLSKIKPSAPITVRIWPLMASICLIAIPVILAVFVVENPLNLLRYPAIGISVWVFSLLFPAVTIVGLVKLIQDKSSKSSKFVYWHAVSVISACLFIALYLASYDLLGFKLWA